MLTWIYGLVGGSAEPVGHSSDVSKTLPSTENVLATVNAASDDHCAACSVVVKELKVITAGYLLHMDKIVETNTSLLRRVELLEHELRFVQCTLLPPSMPSKVPEGACDDGKPAKTQVSKATASAQPQDVEDAETITFNETNWTTDVFTSTSGQPTSHTMSEPPRTPVRSRASPSAESTPGSSNTPTRTTPSSRRVRRFLATPRFSRRPLFAHSPAESIASTVSVSDDF